MSQHRFPTSMRSLREKYPEAARIGQFRIFSKGGTVLCVEGILNDRASEHLAKAFAAMFEDKPESKLTGKDP